MIRVDLNRLARRLVPKERQRLLANFLVQLQPQVIHNLNSHLGYDTFIHFGRALRQNSRLYVSVFCEELSREGKRIGYPFEQLPECWEELTGIFADNQRFLGTLQGLYALDPQRLHVHYQPIELDAISPRTVAEKPVLDVLWAGRLDRQKRPDLLIAIAQRCGHLPIQFHAYGTAVLDYTRKAFSGSPGPNLTFHGPFDRLSSLPLDKFDLFLNTSQWEGLPNILLEAISAGLPVMSSDAGGIPELILPDQTGILVSPFDDVEQYVQRLEQLCATRQQLPTLVARAQELVRQRHSWQSFVQTLATVPGYLPARAAWR